MKSKRGMKSSATKKNRKSKNIKFNKQLKNELKNLTKKWFDSLSNNKKLKSKKNVNRFINILKKNCKKQYGVKRKN